MRSLNQSDFSRIASEWIDYEDAIKILIWLQIVRAQEAGANSSPPPETGTITGVVTAQETGTPLAETRITVAGSALGATAGADGRYTIALVPPGTYRLRAQLIGHAPAEVAERKRDACAKAVVGLTALARALDESGGVELLL